MPSDTIQKLSLRMHAFLFISIDFFKDLFSYQYTTHTCVAFFFKSEKALFKELFYVLWRKLERKQYLKCRTSYWDMTVRNTLWTIIKRPNSSFTFHSLGWDLSTYNALVEIVLILFVEVSMSLRLLGAHYFLESAPSPSRKISLGNS